MLKKLFKSTKVRPAADGHWLTDKAAMKIAGAINRMQNAFALFMNKRTRQFSSRTWKFVLGAFVIIWGGLSFYILSSAFTKQTPEGIVTRQRATIKPLHPDSLHLMEKIYKTKN